MTIRWFFNEGPFGEFQGIAALEIDGVRYSREEVERIVTAHSSGDTPNVCGNGAHRVLEAFCEVSDCSEKRDGRSPYCKKHAMRYRRHGSPETTLRPWDKKKEK